MLVRIYRLLQQIDRKIDLLTAFINEKEEITMSALDDLIAQVQQNTSVEASAALAIQGLSKQLSDALASNDTAQLQALDAQLKASADALVAAIPANTPAATPPAPAPATPPAAPPATP